MKTNHTVIIGNSINMEAVPSESVDLMVTSSPYPIIEMWDEMFARQSSSVNKALEKADGTNAFEFMHQLLDPVWQEVYRVLKVGSFA
jgi:DNA modification methylase